MTFEEAIAAARTIAANYHRLDVMAIGRFLPAEQFVTTPERWGVCVLIDRKNPTVLWESQSMLPFANYDRSNSKTTKKPAAKKSEPIEANDTPLLF